MNTQKIIEIEQFETMVTACYGRPQGDELPQVASPEDIIETLTVIEQ